MAVYKKISPKLSSNQNRDIIYSNKITLLVLILSFICLQHLLNSDIILNRGNNIIIVSATSINYGVIQQPITDINQLMPKLCQNQSVICEGSYCIPGVRKCVCDLRMPVQFGSYCLRQVDIETKCFVTNQCNHTIKDAVCIDINSNSILNAESSKFKLDQWRQLNELRQQSIQATTNSREQVPKQLLEGNSKSRSIFKLANRFKMDEEDVMVVSHYRNSPYEINYNTPELLLQNHTRRKTNNTNGDRLNLYQNNQMHISATTTSPALTNDVTNELNGVNNRANSNYASQEDINQSTTTNVPVIDQDTSTPTTIIPVTKTISNIRSSAGNKEQGYNEETSTRRDINSYYSTAHYQSDTTSVTSQQSTNDYSTTTNNLYDTTTINSLPTTYSSSNGDSNGGSAQSGSRKKMIIKTQNWPPGICACPFGYMFDSMLRKCLAVSLADSHCLVDVDCKQISMSHCSQERKKCECDEPLVWDQKELACNRQKATTTTPANSDDNINIDTRKILGSIVNNGPVAGNNFFENLFHPNMLAKLYPDYIILLMIFIVIILITICIVFKLTANWFSSSGSSALISPKKTNKNSKANLPPRSPYATLKRPDHKPLSNFTQATRGRILNYDFEQDGQIKAHDQVGESSRNQQTIIGGTLKLHHNNHHNHHAKITNDNRSATLKATSSSSKSHNKQSSGDNNNNSKQREKQNDYSNDEQLLELNDNISVSQLESDSKTSDVSAQAAPHMAIPPGPPPNQQPPYMLASAMKGQGSAIAAAAAAIANKRMQKKNLEQQQQQDQQQKYQASPFTPGHPVFL